jgi:putative transposase
LDGEQQAAYQALFEARLDDKTLNDVRAALNKSLVLGNEHFKIRIEAQLNRLACPLPKGNRRPEEVNNITTNRF